PPNWPEPPHDGWIPPADFSPGPSWGPVPAGWRLWSSTAVGGRGPAPLQASEDVPASGARPRRRVDRYPVAVLNPGMWADNHLESEDYGFPPAEPRRDRPRLRRSRSGPARGLRGRARQRGPAASPGRSVSGGRPQPRYVDGQPPRERGLRLPAR